MASCSNWGDGLPSEIMLQIIDTVKERKDVEMFAACAQVNKHWNLASQPDFCEELCVDTVSDYELYSLTKMVKGVKRLEFRGCISNSTVVFYDIAKGFPDLTSLRVSNMRLTDKSLEYISRIPKLEHLILDVIYFSPAGIMELGKLKNLNFMDARSSETGQKIVVDTSLTYPYYDGDLLTEKDMYLPNEIPAVYAGFGLPAHLEEMYDMQDIYEMMHGLHPEEWTGF